MEDNYLYEYHCLGCQCVWLQPALKNDAGEFVKPIPNFCPSCGVKFERFISEDEVC